MRNDWRALFACESGLSEPEIGLEHDKWQNLHGARLQKQPANCFNSFGQFHLISSVSRPQRLLIYDCIYFPSLPPSPVANISEHFIPKVPLETGAPTPNFLMLPTPLMRRYCLFSHGLFSNGPFAL
jgi:hypothetical protein